MEKFRIGVKVSTTNLSGSNANADATSDAIEFPESKAWTLNVWLESAAGSGATVTVQVSEFASASARISNNNDSTSLSFR